ncbi:MAG: hypothetical protein AMJ94_16920 [Deltaproteobacteria bacterium SM23_61]|nr:MAG: hypothetical protein AMJ94_16920 [Deltaproteobacteria bacterium SM23_61]
MIRSRAVFPLFTRTTSFLPRSPQSNKPDPGGVFPDSSLCALLTPALGGREKAPCGFIHSL